MKKGKTEVILVLDRSGSMQGVKNDIEGGLKSFLEKQRSQEGECFVSCYQFDDKYDVVFENKNVKEVTDIKLVPRGWTALLDAMGKTINSVGERLAKTPEEERPELVIFVTLTDGEENRSTEFNSKQIKEMIQHQTDAYKWQFIFLGANQDAVLTGNRYGYSASNSLTYAANARGVSNTFKSLTSGVSCMRLAAHQGQTVADSFVFTDEDRKKALEQ